MVKKHRYRSYLAQTRYVFESRAFRKAGANDYFSRRE
jgi:hypothetical protein